MATGSQGRIVERKTKCHRGHAGAKRQGAVARESSGGAVEGGAPEFIDLLTSENEDYQLAFGGGLMWLDNFCADRYAATFLDSTPAQQKEALDLIAYRKNSITDPTLTQGVTFFARLRQMTCDGFYTSKIGIEDLQYIGNTALASFPGCPPFPES